MTIGEFVHLAGCGEDLVKVYTVDGTPVWEGCENTFPQITNWEDKPLVQWSLEEENRVTALCLFFEE